jgi:hypothetical protein
MKKVITNIEDFHKINVGDTLVLFCGQTHNNEILIHEIIGIYSGTRKIRVSSDQYGEGEDDVDDVFNSYDIIDIVFPCSVDEVQELYPEYFI